MSLIPVVPKTISTLNLAPPGTQAAALETLQSKKFRGVKELIAFIDTYPPEMRYELEVQAGRTLAEIILNMGDSAEEFID